MIKNDYKIPDNITTVPKINSKQNQKPHGNQRKGECTISKPMGHTKAILKEYIFFIFGLLTYNIII